VKTSELELDMAMVEERRYEESEEYEEFDVFNTDRDIVKGHITFKFEENKEDVEVPTTPRRVQSGRVPGIRTLAEPVYRVPRWDG
jgi:hypothetical protein